MFGLIPQTVRRAREERLPQVAGSLTFTTVLSLVPLLAVGFALFTRVPALRGTGQAIQQHLLSGLLPPELARTVVQRLAQFTANTGGLTPVGAVFLVLSALATAFAVETTLNRLWQVRKPRPIGQRLGLYAVLLVVAPALVGAILWATAALQATSGALAAGQPRALVYGLQVAPMLVAGLGFAALFRFVPHAPVRRRHALVGGLLAGCAFELGKRGFALYLAQVPTYRTVYGAFAPLLAFLLWVYFSWLVTLLCGLVTAGLGRSGSPRRQAG